MLEEEGIFAEEEGEGGGGVGGDAAGGLGWIGRHGGQLGLWLLFIMLCLSR